MAAKPDVSSNAKHCGACGNVCPVNKPRCIHSACIDPPVNPFFDSMPMATGSVQRAAGNACGTLITANQNATVMAIAVYLSHAGLTNVKFMIWSHPGHQLLYISPPMGFGPGMGWRKSDYFAPFQLVAGQSYDIGGTADQTVTYYYDQAVESQNGITSLSQNANFTSYAMPAFSSHAAVDCAVQLF